MDQQRATTIGQHKVWLDQLQILKNGFVERYERAPRNGGSRKIVYRDFCTALALFYGVDPNAQDIIDEVEMELSLIEK
jgi:hypothetical protein